VEDVNLLKDLGVDVYRFSISWPRIYPNGTGKINQKGLDYYHRLVDKLIENGIEPMCTLYHWDLPQSLQDRGGWEKRETIEAFVQYAETIYKALNGKVKYWITINEPWCVSFLSNYYGVHAPGNRDLQVAVDISHHLLLAHGKAVKRFRELEIGGKIGYAPNTTWKEPFSNNQEDIDACHREMGLHIDWFFDPVFNGSYPKFLNNWLRDKGASLNIRKGDLETISQRIDFIGINYYTGNIGRYKKNEGLLDIEYIDIGEGRTDFNWTIYPEGLYKVLLYITNRYGKVPIYITENGACYNDEPENGKIKDERRIKYLKQHLTQIKRAIDSGVHIDGYLAWSLLDNFEWSEGFTKRFGIVHVDFNTLKRTKKESFYWYKKMILNNWMEI
jgi:beta-glucosidase